MKFKLKQIIFNLISFFKLPDILSLFEKNSIKIITFHRFHKGMNDNFLRDGLSISNKYLEEILKYIQKKYTIISLDEAILKINNNQIDKKYIVITIDDGYKDNYEIAYPIFKKYNTHFMIYITTSFLEKTMILWWYVFGEIIKQHQKIEFEFEEKNYSFDKDSVSLLRRMLLNQNKQNYFKLLNIILEKYNIDDKKYSNLFLDFSEVEKLLKDKIVTIGAHTHNHLSLSSLDIDDMKEEISKSKKILEERLNIKINHFAYPYGSENEVNKEVIKVVSNLDFISAVTTKKGKITTKIDLFDIPRYIINGNYENIDYFKWQIR